MMENHSYDNYLGMLPGRGEGFPLAPDGQPDVYNDDGRRRDRPRLPPALDRPAPGRAVAELAREPPAVGRGKVRRVRDQRAGRAGPGRGRHRGGPPTPRPRRRPSAWATGPSGTCRSTTGWPGPSRWPIAGSARAWVPTFPNRRFLIAGTAHGLIDDSPYDLLDYPPAGTIFDLLTEHGISWANYHPVADDEPPVAALRPAHEARWPGAACSPLGRPVPPWPSGVAEGPAVHRRRLPARDRPVHAACPRHSTSSSPTPPRHAAGLQHRRPGLRRLLRGEPAGHHGRARASPPR